MKNRKTFWTAWFITFGIIIITIALSAIVCSFLCNNPECNHGLLVLKIASEIFIAATAIAGVIFNFIDYVNMNKANHETVRMKFNHFKDVYYIRPDRWDITPDHWSSNFGRLRYRAGKWGEDRYFVTFSYFDWLKFLLWQKVDKYEKKIKRKRNEQEESNIRMAEMLKYIQKDIDEAYEKISKE